MRPTHRRSRHPVRALRLPAAASGLLPSSRAPAHGTVKASMPPFVDANGPKLAASFVLLV
jgi:hypothetical protein